jgi:hypothetical protein
MTDGFLNETIKIMSSFEKGGGAAEVEVTADDVAASIDWIEQQLTRRRNGEQAEIARDSHCPLAMAVKRATAGASVHVDYWSGDPSDCEYGNVPTVTVREDGSPHSALYYAAGAKEFIELFDSRRSWKHPSSFLEVLEAVGLEFPLPVDLTLDEG